jgi:hypothetical protein
MVEAIFSEKMTLAQFEARFQDDATCRACLQESRWPNGVCCPRCSNPKVYPVANRPFHWQCQGCTPGGGYRFSVLVGTIFENTNIGLREWFRVIHMMLNAKKPIPVLEVQRIMGFGSYRTAHYLVKRIRNGLEDPEFRQLMGIDAAPSLVTTARSAPMTSELRMAAGD